MSFGHKFKDRHGHLSKITTPDSSDVQKSLVSAGNRFFESASKFFNNFSTPTPNSTPQESSTEQVMREKLFPKEISPIFLQFLDSLYQIWKQYPTEFEYDEKLLEFLYIASHSCEFGNFLFNSEYERKTFNSELSNMQSINVDIRLTNEIELKTKSIWQHVSLNKSSYTNSIYIPVKKVLNPDTKDLVYWSRVYKISSFNYGTEENHYLDVEAKLTTPNENLELNSNFEIPKSEESRNNTTKEIGVRNESTMQKSLQMNMVENPWLDLNYTRTPKQVETSLMDPTKPIDSEMKQMTLSEDDDAIPNPLMNPW
jgi:hypothetical protein